MFGFEEAPLKALPDVAIPAQLTKLTQGHVQEYLIGVADAPESAADLITKWRMILVIRSSGSTFVKHSAAIKEKGKETERRRGLEIGRRRGHLER